MAKHGMPSKQQVIISSSSNTKTELEQLNELKQLIIGGFNEVNERLDRLEKDVSQLKTDVNTIGKNTGHQDS